MKKAPKAFQTIKEKVSQALDNLEEKIDEMEITADEIPMLAEKAGTAVSVIIEVAADGKLTWAEGVRVGMALRDLRSAFKTARTN